MKKVVIIVAGGSGSRMNTDKPKQFLILGNKPVLQHTIEKFYNYDSQIEIIVVLPENYISLWKNLCFENTFNIEHKIVTGGKERFFSVKNAIDILENVDLVAIHDGVRPFVSLSTINEAFETAKLKGNAIPVITAFDSVRISIAGGNKPLDRKIVKLVQTPQVFKFDLIKNAYNQTYVHEFTDDASVVEMLGEKINLTEGNRENIKITTPEDLIIGEAFLKKEIEK